MTKEYMPLSTHPLTTCNSIVTNRNLPEIVHLDDPAIHTMIDFAVLSPLTIGPERPIFEARKIMENSGNSICLVTDDHDCIRGILALQDILGSKPVKLSHDLRVARKELKVKSIMIPIADLEAINFSSLSLAKVGHIVATLQKSPQHYVLVCEGHHGEQQLRGIFIDSQIEKQLGTSIRNPTQPLSFAELQQRLSR